MNLKKAIGYLRKLIDSDVHDIGTYTQAHTLISAFYEENRDADGKMINSYSEEKIDDVEIYFQILCNLGEDGFDEDDTRRNILSAIYKLEMIISNSGYELSPPGARQ